MTAPLPHRMSRRGALTGGLAVLATAGCDAVGSLSPDEPRPETDPSTPTAGADPDPDEAVVAEVHADLADASVLVAAALRSRPGLRGELAPFASLHAAHLRALDGRRPGGRVRVPRDVAALRVAVRSREARLERSLATAALAAQSGPLAALLASMSAAVAQQLAVTEIRS